MTTQPITHTAQFSSHQQPLESSNGLAEALSGGQVWQGKHWQNGTQATLSTGHAALDELLQGWPQGALSEILYSQSGIGEMRLLVPALAALSQQDRWIMMVAPPFLPNDDALTAAGVDTSKLLVVRPESVRDLLWTLEEGLRSGTCSAVLAWPARLDTRQLRRLQLAAEQGQALGFMFRPTEQVDDASPAALRLRIQPTATATRVEVIKRRGGWAPEPVQMDLGLMNPALSTGDAVIQGPWATQQLT